MEGETLMKKILIMLLSLFMAMVLVTAAAEGTGYDAFRPAADHWST